MVPGAHLYRSPYLWNTRRSEFDEQFELPAGCGAGSTPSPGSPCASSPSPLPRAAWSPSSITCPTRVGFRDEDAPTRWGLLMAYRTPDPEAEPAPWNEGVPAHWAERQEAAGRITASMRRVFEGDNPPV